MKRLVLAGAGHTHVEVLRRFADPLPAAEVVLVTPVPYHVYSGMVPGCIAGEYRLEDISIDVGQLCARANVRAKLAQVDAIDCERRTLHCSDGSRIEYDLLSLDIGSVPAGFATPGVPDHVVALKPFAHFTSAWNAMRRSAGRKKQRIAVVGAGAAGVEVALAMKRALRAARADAEVFLLTESECIVPDHAKTTRRRLARILHEQGIVTRVRERVVRVTPGSIHTEHGAARTVDQVVWATGAAPPAWIGQTDLARDAKGFVLVGEMLQSISHPEVFAAGDIATMRGFPRPRAGVYAVRQGPPLAQNLRSALAGKPLIPHRPQRLALALLNCGNGYAVGEYGRISFEGKWVWRWKDFIDRRFVERYR